MLFFKNIGRFILSRKFSLLLISGLYSFSSFATHIIGGEIFYKCLGNDKYEITLKIYRDCYNGIPFFDDTASVGIFDSAYVLVDTLLIPLPDPPSDTLDPLLNSPCLLPPQNVCVEEAVYVDTLHLPPRPGGYTLSYQRCCRNHTINNIIAPGNTGSTYKTVINDTSIVKCNSSPFYNNFPPVFICVDELLEFDHSATDPDGDSLFYTMCTPFHGAEPFGGFDCQPQPCGPKPNPPFNPPYDSIQWKPPYHTNDPLGGVPLTIDPVTGKLTGVPNTIGQFVVGVCVEEYRNGVFLGVNKRDFQFNVLQCIPKTTASITPSVVQCNDSVVQFENKSIGAISYFWDFGIDTTSADTSLEATPVYTYPDTGVYTVTLIVNRGLKCADTVTSQVSILPLPKVDFTGEDACLDQPNSFVDLSSTPRGKITKWTWKFDDGKTDNAPNPDHVFPNEGNHKVELVIETDYGCKDSISKNVEVHHLPVADFEADTACLNDTTRFLNLTTVKDAQINLFVWDFGEGLLSNQQDPVLKYGNAGIYEVRLVAISEYGCKDTIFKSIKVRPLPDPDFDFGTPCALENIEFTEKSTIPEGNITGWFWDYGDGSRDTLEDPVHTFAENKAYEVKLINESEFGCMDSITKTINVKPKPVADFDFSNQCASFANAFTDRSYVLASEINNWAWDFGDTTYSSQQHPEHEYEKIGSYGVSLIVTTTDNCKDTIVRIVNMFPDPDPSFKINSEEGCQPFTVDFSASELSDTAGFYIWDFGDGSTATGLQPTHIYEEPGTYTITLTITSSQGCSDSLTVADLITVHPKPDAQFTPNPEKSNIFLPDFEFTDNSKGAVGWEWLFDDSVQVSGIQHPSQSFPDTGWHDIRLVVESDMGCKDTIVHRVYVEPHFTVYVPNSFSPNGDGVNDIFIAGGIGIKEFGMSVYDRWGLKIFESETINKGWDGRYKNEIVPEDVYVYVIQVKDVFDRLHRYVGHVSVVR